MENKREMIHVVNDRPDMQVSVLEQSVSGRELWYCLAATLLLLMTPLLLYAEIDPGHAYGGSRGEQQNLSVPLHKSIVIKLPDPVGQVSVANPELVDILVINSREIYLVGKRLGTTNAILWDRAKRVQEIIGLQVTHDLDGLKQKLHQFLPDENIQVASSQESIVLSGEVSSPQKMSAALDLANTYLMDEKKQGDKGDENSKLLNLMQIGGAQQVLLEVKVAEISRSLVRRLDINFSAFSTDSHWSLGAVNGG
ncbi:MAG: pilus assembly protein N-terminal domain-containing protein, partial [Candidatus Thiodiazotropha sp.]